MLTRLLSVLPLLACPLLMLACMWAMRGSGTRAAQGQAGRVAELERELADLRARLPREDAAGASAPASRPDHTLEMRPPARQHHRG